MVQNFCIALVKIFFVFEAFCLALLRSIVRMDNSACFSSLSVLMILLNEYIPDEKASKTINAMFF